MLIKIMQSKHGEGYIDVAVLVLCAMLVIVLAVKIFPVYIAKNQPDTFANELCGRLKLRGVWAAKPAQECRCFGSFPITLTAKASGKGEVYWK